MLACIGNTSSRMFDAIPYDTKDAHFVSRYCNSGEDLSGNIADKRLRLLFLLSLSQKHLYNLGFDNLRTPGELVVKEFATSQASAIDVENWLTKVEQVMGIKFKIVIFTIFFPSYSINFT